MFQVPPQGCNCGQSVFFGDSSETEEYGDRVVAKRDHWSTELVFIQQWRFSGEDGLHLKVRGDGR